MLDVCVRGRLGMVSLVSFLLRKHNLAASIGFDAWVGSHGALGLFYWASGSVKDREIGTGGLDVLLAAGEWNNATDTLVHTA